MDSIVQAKKTVFFVDMSYFYVPKGGQQALYAVPERFVPDFGMIGYIRFDGVLSNNAAMKHLLKV